VLQTGFTSHLAKVPNGIEPSLARVTRRTLSALSRRSSILRGKQCVRVRRRYLCHRCRFKSGARFAPIWKSGLANFLKLLAAFGTLSSSYKKQTYSFPNFPEAAPAVALAKSEDFSMILSTASLILSRTFSGNVDSALSKPT
jgi:hypothetical protein